MTQTTSTQNTDVVRTFIWGSCVSRDTFGTLPEKFQLTTYVARQSLISAGNDASAIRSKLTPLSSAFQQRMVRGDLAGDLFRRIAAVGDEIDLVLIDLVDERSGVVDFGDGRYATKLSEFWGAGGRKASKGLAVIPFGTDEHLELWTRGAESFVNAMREKNLLDRALVLRADWATHFNTGEEFLVPDWITRPADANAAYAPYFDALAAMHLNICDLPADLARTDRNHQWGPSPFHYQAKVPEYFAAEIQEMVHPN